MGYCTWFNGGFDFDKKPSDSFIEYIRAFSETRHVKYDVDKIKENDPDWIKHCFDGILGVEGAYYIGGKYDSGMSKNGMGTMVVKPSIKEMNYPPIDVPSLWCDWTISDDGKHIVWDESEKFYNYIEWIEYLIENFIKPCGYTLNGEVTWEGEERTDNGKIIVVNNLVEIQYGIICYCDDDLKREVTKLLTDEELVDEFKRRGLV